MLQMSRSILLNLTFEINNMNDSDLQDYSIDGENCLFSDAELSEHISKDFFG